MKIDKANVKEGGCVPIKLYSQKQARARHNLQAIITNSWFKKVLVEYIGSQAASGFPGSLEK